MLPRESVLFRSALSVTRLKAGSAAEQDSACLAQGPGVQNVPTNGAVTPPKARLTHGCELRSVRDHHLTHVPGEYPIIT